MHRVFSVSCFQIFTLSLRASLYYSASLSHPLILPLCLCEEACSPAGTGCRDARLKDPRGERFLNPSCPPGLMQCISLLLGVFVQHTRRSITSDPSNDKLRAPPPALKTPSFPECCYPLLLRRNWGIESPCVFCLWSQTIVIFSRITANSTSGGQEVQHSCVVKDSRLI